ncbi:Glutathione peroxidase [Heracleum sosnowskyi]|uniref:Glutathione peroxidase n=1 Tax=Heracleum sosnowskyi TaxID=360622 RepID=A0AAD8MI84_9APIA|nr:Glutathione peroxidase [Heracleum sosnowskyi]
MAPNRRKAAKSGGDQREWNAGDLVLAKVKGFPAWPARVDDSVKWGFPAEPKKVFVYFFGTRQIAFCNPVDVEAFTEDKKQLLKVKHHAKGSDFVLAVNEINEYFAKLKSEDRSTNVTMPNGSNSAESLADFYVKGEASKAISGTFRESADSSKVKLDDGITVGEASASEKQDPFHVDKTPSEDPTCNVNEKEMPLPTMYTMKNKKVTQTQNFITEKRVMSAQWSRNSSQVDSHKLRNSIQPSSNIIRTAGIVDQNGMRDASSKIKRIKKSPDLFELNDVDSPTFVSSSSYEENDSETGMADSDTLSFNGGIIVESGYKLAQTESVVECSFGDTELIQRPDLQSSAVIVKKKRKPSKKRANSGTNERIIGRFQKQPELETETEEHTAGQILPSNNKDWDAKYINEVGDEHLPLLKRARVRMGGPSSEVEEPDSSVQLEEKPSEVSDCRMVQLKAPLNSEVDSALDRNPSVGMEGFDNSSMTKNFPLNNAPHGEVKKFFGRPLDVEAALPPSKRIQRALEAMSANVSEDVQETSKAPSSMRSFVNASCFLAASNCYNTSPGNKLEGETILCNVDLSGRAASQDEILGSSTNLISLGDDKDPASCAEVKDCNISLSGIYSPKPTSCGTGVAVEVVDYSDCKDPGVSSLSKNLPEPIVMSQRPVHSAAVVLDRGLISQKGKQEDILRPSVDSHRIVNLEAGKPFQENDPTRISTKNLDPVLVSEGIVNGLTHVDTDPLPCNLQNNCDTNNLSKLDTDKDNKDKGMFVLKEKTTVKDFEVFPSSPKEARPTSLQDVPHLLLSRSDSEDHSSCKDVSDIGSSPSSNGGSDSVLVPLDNTSGCNVTAADNVVLYSNNGCCSLDAPSPHEYPKHAGKENGKVQASDALASFKVFLRLLTRTKDSIGCVTRIALECGKLGIASEVVEVLACYLEREPRLPKRVDLFFLVDSILQCSRGLKGEIGGLYSSGIQALLPRFLLAAAPPGSNGQENRRQCLKVLRLWQERRVLPESVIHRHIQDLDSACNPASVEQVFDDPLREVQGMVDDYGSNPSFQLPCSRMPKDEGCDSDGENFEAVTPEHNSEKTEGQIPIAAKGKQSYLLDPVDGEVEMEDVSPWEADDLDSTGNVRDHIAEDSKHRFEQKSPVNFPPPPKNVAPSSPPRIAPQPPLPLLPSPLLSTLPNPLTNVTDSKLYVSLNSYSQVDGAIAHSKTFHTMPHISETVNSRPSGGVPVSRLQVQPVNSAPHINGALSQKKSFHLRPPQPAPSNQFSYVKSDHQKPEHRTPTREIPSLSYPNRLHFLRNRDRGNFYVDHDRFEAGPHDVGNNWSHSEPSFAGPNYHDRRRLPYANSGPLREPPLSNRSWAFPLRDMNHREVMPRRPPLGGPIPVASRGPNYWQSSPR